MEELTCYSAQEIQQLLLYFAKNTYRAKESDDVGQEILQKCIDLVSLDYSHMIISNAGGELSANYPAQIIIMEYERRSRNSCSTTSVPCNNANVTGSGPSNSPEPRPQATIYENMYDSGKLRDLFGKARFARCRARFPIPVIYFRGKYVCRSATLSGGPEIYGRSGLDYFFSGDESLQPTEDDLDGDPLSVTSSDWQLFDRVRNSDIRLLQMLNVETIIDLMVEKKKVKFGMNVTSSEKVDKENRYCDFKIVSLPYPGCEFFKEYRDNDYIAKDLVFDWSQPYVDATLGVPEDSTVNQLRIDWNNYKMWDLISLTQNYVRLLLRYLVEQSNGILVHCISGWDRTPLFISLLRLSLWADGVIHQSLSPYQILYFTIAYDWMLFGHNLEDRLLKGEDIFFFCFYVLKFLVGDEYSVLRKEKSSKPHGSQPVLRTDSDSQLEGVLFEQEGPVSSQGSNVSLNSSWSSISSKSQEAAPVFYSTDDTDGNAVQIPFMASCQVAYSSSSSSDLTSTSKEGQLAGNCQSAACVQNQYQVQTSLSAGISGTVESVSQVQCKTMTGASHLVGGECHNSGDKDCLSCNGNSAGAAQGQAAARFPASPVRTRTSPVAVPSRPSIGHRNESTSSLNVGSWQFITGTGSLGGSGCGSDSACSSQTGRNVEAPNTRRERLRTVRELFYNCYCSTIGLKMKDGSEGGLGNLLGNFAERVGIKSPQ